MKIAVTVWGNRISPVFDAARTLLITQVKDGMIVKKSYEPFDSSSAEQLIDMLKEMDISTLICGAISSKPADVITGSGICLIPFVTGNALVVLDHYAYCNKISKDNIMPGCTVSFSGKD